MPALAAICYNPDLRAKYRQLVAQGKPRKVAVVAVMRSSSCWPTRYLERIAAGCPTGLGGAAQPGREARRWSPHDQLFNVNCPCRTGVVTRSEACRASRRRPELGGVAAKAARQLGSLVPITDTGEWTPTSLPPVYDRGRGRASRRRVDAVPASAFPSVDPNVTAPGLRPGAREASRKASRCRSRVSVPSVDPASLPPVYDRGRGRASRKASRRRSRVSVPYRLAVAAPRRSCETLLGCRVRVVCDRARSRCQGRQPRAAGAERSDAP